MAAMTRSPSRVPALGLALVLAVNAVVVAWLWLRHGPGDVHSVATALVGAGRLTGLLGAYLALVSLVLLSRLPWLERFAGLDRRVAWHRPAAVACLGLLCLHAVLITAGYALGDRLSLPAEVKRLITGYPGVITATVGLALLIGVSVSCAGRIRRALRYETWHFAHLYVYLAIALAFSHQIATGSDFVGDPVARTYWTALYVATAAVVVFGRVIAPLLSAARHRLRVLRVVDQGPGVTTIEIGGRALHRLRARSGQFFAWRFLTPGRWWEAHPFSLSAAPDGRRLRITVKGLGDYSARLAGVPVGTRVIAEGPFGTFMADRRRCPRVALIAGGAGITPIRALLEDMPGEPGEIAVVYRAARDSDLILRDELDALAVSRGAEIHYLVGADRAPSGTDLLALVPDIAQRDVYVCGPPEMTRATRSMLRGLGVPGRQINLESFTL
jgi:predicted ferric reductase